MNPINERIKKIEDFFQSAPKFAIAFSGGMDSSLLALLAEKFIPERYIAIFVRSEFISQTEADIAESVAATYGLQLRKVSIELLNDKKIRENSNLRCYYCKKFIFSHLLSIAADAVVCEGSVTDDLDDFRPGKKAVCELGIKSPLLESEFSKTDVAEALKYLGASDLIRPAQSCLATRIMADQQIDKKNLVQIETGEKLLRESGLDCCRLRHHQDIARIEVPKLMLHEALNCIADISDEIKKLGFRYVTLDLDGYQKGSMNRL
jgi:uncharacterized protein